MRTPASLLRRFVLAQRRERSLWLFGYVFLAQLGHLIEHISVAIQGKGLLGSGFDSELSHLLFNGLILVLAVVLVAVYPQNPWVYPLLVIATFHEVEHVYIFIQFMRSGTVNGPGLLGIGGAIGIVPLTRIDMHNVYNGIEMILIVLGFWNETEVLVNKSVLDRSRGSHNIRSRLCVSETNRKECRCE